MSGMEPFSKKGIRSFACFLRIFFGSGRGAMLALRCPPAFHAPVAPPTRPAPRHVERGREASGQAACLATALLLGASVRTATARAARHVGLENKKVEAMEANTNTCSRSSCYKLT